jgi:hypothetical protein
MSTGTTGTDDDRRWAEAEAILDNSQDETVRNGIRRRRSRMIALMVGVLVLCTVLGAVAGWLVADRAPDADAASHSSGPLWVEITGLTVAVLGLLVGAYGIVQLVRAGQWGGRWKAPTSVLSRQQKRELRRQVTGAAPVDAAHLRLARDLARRTSRSRSQMWTLGSTGLLQLGLTLAAPSGRRFVFLGLLVLMLGTSAVMLERDVRRARRFLLQNPEPTMPAKVAADDM